MIRLPRNSGIYLGLLGLATAAFTYSCDAMSEIRNMDLGDISPPLLSNHVVQDSGTITLEFDEEVLSPEDGL